MLCLNIVYGMLFLYMSAVWSVSSSCVDFCSIKLTRKIWRAWCSCLSSHQTMLDLEGARRPRRSGRLSDCRWVVLVAFALWLIYLGMWPVWRQVSVSPKLLQLLKPEKSHFACRNLAFIGLLHEKSVIRLFFVFSSIWVHGSKVSIEVNVGRILVNFKDSIEFLFYFYFLVVKSFNTTNYLSPSMSYGIFCITDSVT